MVEKDESFYNLLGSRITGGNTAWVYYLLNDEAIMLKECDGERVLTMARDTSNEAYGAVVYAEDVFTARAKALHMITEYNTESHMRGENSFGSTGR